jgi:CubicO group peptidase (beta-lactamase class C family)
MTTTGAPESIEALLDRLVVAPAVAPAASAAVCWRSEAGWRARAGAAGRIGRHVRAEPSTVFDLASVTKPFVAVTLARLAQRGVLDFETELGEALPELARTASARVTLELLLAHRGGLEPHRKLYAPLLEQRAFAKGAALDLAANARRPDCAGDVPRDGFPPVYSDLGYLLVGEAIAGAARAPLDRVVQSELGHLIAPDIDSARGHLARSPDFSLGVAPTETMAFRGGEIRGAVHDENAWAFGGHGLSGQAGLFGTAPALARFGAAFLDALAGRDDRLLAPEVAWRLVRPRAAVDAPPAPGNSLRAGFDGKSGAGSAAGERASGATFGHLGFTGTSLWCDPRAEIVTVLLTNRVCPSRDNAAIRLARPAVHDGLFALGERGLVTRDKP